MAVMVEEDFEVISQGQIAQREKLSRGAEVFVHKAGHRQVILALTFFQITQKAAKTMWLNMFKLAAHLADIACECQLTSIVKDQVIGRIYSLKIKCLMH